ncbi:Spectrin repeat-containing protein [Venustampulla echinocandica]|uniref:Spectrin repeat-containing protein n=1 Tax=Venustampulla echinocandica TaxID=2656787 RepID=A0A370TVU1_9HELO|nr:Spectrin repeat-containing protein [Venustampulla echinocandica]RDL39653.1 Spectrin repeat-containing protein [Venustampulla echinocandica]
MATEVVDINYLSGYLSLPHDTLVSVLDAPTTELVRSVLYAVTAKAREHDTLAADKLRVDIELENAVRSSETRIDGLRTGLEKAQKTVEEVRTKLKEEETARSSLETELQNLKSSSSTSTSEAETLRARILSLEAANRDTVALLESKTTANDDLAKEVQKQHQKGLELSQQITSIQQQVQNANSAASSAKFREQSLKQEVELAKGSAEWFENELKTKNAEAQKYRKEKGARIAELQRLNEDANSNLEALKKTEQALRNRLDEVQKKAEDSLTKVQQLQEAAAKTEEGFRQELESARRLAELQSQQTETHRNRLKEVETELDKVKVDAAEEIGRCRQEAEVEREEREQVDRRVEELEEQVDHLQAQPRPSSIPGTPRQGLNGSVYGRSGSPAQFASPGSVRSKSAITATQAIDELYKVKGLLTTERRRSERLAAEMETMVEGLEAKQPEIEELQAEHERLQQEVVEMSKFVDQTGKERDRSKKDLRKAESDASTAQAEANILRQQLRDLSAQVKMLLCDLDARERGIDALSAAERSQLERLARGEISEEALEGLTDTDRFISQRLTVFRSVSELQEKNQELLKITRQLGAQMESEEALAAKHQAAKDHEEVQSLQAKIENYKDELQSMLTRSESYIKERDMFRRMLQHRGQLPPASDLASVFGQSIDGSQNGLVPTVEQNPANSTNYPVLLRELQAHFDQYRNEQTIDRRTLKEQTEKLSLEKGTLQAEIAKVSSQLTFSSERYDMLQANYNMLQNENSELQKRSQTLSEAAAKQDLRTQQVAEDLIEAKGLVESMRNENANLKAEKKLFKDIQDRLSADNEALMNERTRLNNLIANQQSLQNERELSESETRRRLQTQVESLEAELSATKRKLSDETEDNKKAQLRKEYDFQQNQKRIDDLASSLSQVREELVAAKTSRDHLQARVDELTIELKSAEERVTLLQPRPTPRTAPSTDKVANTNEDVSADEDREQQLGIEVSELKRDLELAKSELENTKSQMEQYKSISQSSEEELQSLNDTQDQYREEMDRIIAEKDSKIGELEQRVLDISTELTTTNNELTSVRNQQADTARQADDYKAILEQEISRLKDQDERHATAAQFHQQDLRAQAAIATKAQQDYENELVKHAEAAKLLQNLRGEYNQLKSESASFKADAESARVALSQSQASWDERRHQFEQELKELRARRDDVNAQNKLLHQQLESVGDQISALQQSRTTLADTGDAASPAPGSTYDRTADGLRELNAFLRREKEIVEVQYDLKVQESKRLQQQVDYTQSQLDEARLKLDQERHLHADGSRSSVAHKDLMEKLNELNLFRESSITLRNEARQAQVQLSEKTKRVEELTGQIQPLETKIRELEHGKETMDGEMRLLQEDRDRWQKRTQDIISKYDRIDPAEMEQLKETIETLRTERDTLLEDRQPQQEKIQSLEAEKATWQQSRQKLIDQAKERSRVQTKENNNRTAERDVAIQEKDALQLQLSGIQQQLASAIEEKGAAEQQLAIAVKEQDIAEKQLVSLRQELEGFKSERDRLAAISEASVSQAPVTQPPPTEAAGQQHNEVAEQQLAQLRKQLDDVTQEKVSLESQVKDLREQLQKVTSERDNAASEALEARSNQTINTSNNTLASENEDGQIDESPKASVSETERRVLEERIAAADAKAKECEEKAAKIEKEMDDTVKARSEKMKAALNKKLAESRETQKKQLEAEYDLKLEQERQIWLAESKAAAPPAPLTVSTTPSATPSKPSVDTPSAAAAAPTTPATPATPGQRPPVTTFDSTNLSDAQVRDFLSNNVTVKSIVTSNVKKKVDAETQKLKEEYEKRQAQAVFMTEKKSSLRLNIADNRIKVANGKLEIVETAARETPQKPVVEVWEVAKAYKPPPPTPETTAQPNGTPSSAPKVADVKTEAGTTSVPQPSPQTQNAPPGPTNGTASIPTPAVIPTLNAGNNTQAAANAGRTSGIPTMRGGAAGRGRGGNQVYQAGRGGGVPGRGRGNAPGQRGGLNAGAPAYNPQGQAGVKRAREEGSIGGPGNSGKRARGGGQNN